MRISNGLNKILSANRERERERERVNNPRRIFSLIKTAIIPSEKYGVINRG